MSSSLVIMQFKKQPQQCMGREGKDALVIKRYGTWFKSFFEGDINLYDQEKRNEYSVKQNGTGT